MAGEKILSRLLYKYYEKIKDNEPKFATISYNNNPIAVCTADIIMENMVVRLLDVQAKDKDILDMFLHNTESPLTLQIYIPEYKSYLEFAIDNSPAPNRNNTHLFTTLSVFEQEDAEVLLRKLLYRTVIFDDKIAAYKNPLDIRYTKFYNNYLTDLKTGTENNLFDAGIDDLF